MRRVFLTLFLMVVAAVVSRLPKTEIMEPSSWSYLQAESSATSLLAVRSQGWVGLGEGVTLLVVDSSGSMRKSERRSQEALDALMKVQTENVGLVTFGDTGRMVVAPERPIQEVQAVLGTLPSRGGSNLDAGLSTALDWFESHDQPGNIFLVSDGSANVGEVDPAKILVEASRAARLGVRIFVAESGEPEGTLLMDLSERSGGLDWQVGQELALVVR